MNKLKTVIVTLGLVTWVTLGTSTYAHPTQKVKPSELICLAKNIYYEARGEPLEGQLAVAQVTLNRVKSRRFHNTVCEVVYAPSQFSWTLNKHRRVRDKQAWNRSVSVARAVLSKSIALPDFPALYFHTPEVNPRWNRQKPVLARIGNHIFYR